MTCSSFAIGAGLPCFCWSGPRHGHRLRPGHRFGGLPRPPRGPGKINSTMILGCALAEATAIYGFVIGLMILFVL